MLIGLDFDNTIVRYDRVFHDVALEKGLIQTDIPVSKVAVRDVLRAQGLEEDWIAIQGYVYGCRMDEAEMFEGVIDTLEWAADAGHDCAIISHRTRHPYRGPAYDLHASAAAWVERHLCADGRTFVSSDRVSFHETKAEKIDQIGRRKCDVFLDDLPEILAAETFPIQTRPILFDPDDHHDDITGIERILDWPSLKDVIS